MSGGMLFVVAALMLKVIGKHLAHGLKAGADASLHGV
jgi:hypothetical protein